VQLLPLLDPCAVLQDILSKDAASSDSEEEEEGLGTTSSTSSPVQLPGPNLGPTPAAATGAVAQVGLHSLCVFQVMSTHLDVVTV
jgi:hypothetical protein